MNRTPTPTECTLRLLRTPNVYPRTRNIYPRTPRFTPTYTHCRGRFIVPAYHGIYGVDNRVQPMFYPRAPIVIRGCNLHNSVRTGAMNRSPTPTECMLQLLRTPNVYPRTRNIYPRTPSFTPTYTHCREPIHRARISRNIWCGLSTHTNVYLRMPYILKCGYRAICTNKMWWYYVS